IFLVAWYHKRKPDPVEKKTFWVLWAFWAPTIFVMNFIGYKLGILSFLPWLNNFLHTFLWIGITLSWLFIAVYREHMVLQFLAFALFSLVVRYAEYNLYGIWELDHFLKVFPGTHAYIVGWSFVDGFYSIVTFLVLRLLSKKVAGLIVEPGPPRRV
ncbi:MAG: hypothetical protein ACRET3_04720, partial [Burkholderiales bacterium]